MILTRWIAALTISTGTLFTWIEPARAASGNYIANTSGNWSNPANWNGGTVADGTGSIAYFGNTLNGSTTVTLDSARTIRDLIFLDSGNGLSSWTLQGSAPLTLDVTSGSPTITTFTPVTISVPLAGNDGLTKTGIYQLSLLGANTYTGTTTINQGTLHVGNGGASGNLGTGDIVIAAGRLEFQRNDAFTVSNNISGGGQFYSISGSPTLTGNNSSYTGPMTIATSLRVGDGGTTGTLGSGEVTMFGSNVLTFNRSDESMVSSAIDSDGSAVKLGAGKLIVTGRQTYFGTVTIGGGTVQIGNGGATGQLSPSHGIVNNGALVFNRSDTYVQGGIISGSGSLSQISSGTLILSALSSYTGTTTISAGTLQVGNGSLFGNLGTGSVINNAALAFNRDEDIEVNNAISGTGTLAKKLSNMLTLTGTNTYGGTTTIEAGTLRIGNGGTAGSLGTGAVTNNAGLVFFRSDVVVVDNAISGTGSVTQMGGNLTLTGANEYLGATRVDAGTLKIGAIAANGMAQPLGRASSAIELGSTTAGVLAYTGASAATLGRGFTIGGAGGGTIVNSDGNTLTLSASIDKTLGPLTLTGGAFLLTAPITGGATPFTITDGATVTLQNSASTYAGITSVAGSTLILSGSASIAQSPEIRLSGGSTLDVASVAGGSNHDGTHFSLVSGQTLRGEGMVAGAMNVASGAVLSPEGAISTPGMLQTDDLSLLGTAEYQLSLHPGTLQSDLLRVNGDFSLDLADSVTLSLDLLGGDVALDLGSYFTIVDYSGEWNGGTFADLPDDSTFTFGVNLFRISYDGLDGTTSAVTLEAVAAVPEPGTVLFGLACVGALLVRRRGRLSRG